MVKCALLKGKYGYYLSICRSEKQQPMLCQKASRGGRLFLYREYYLRGDIRRVGARAVRGSWCRERARPAGPPRRPPPAERPRAPPSPGGRPRGANGVGVSGGGGLGGRLRGARPGARGAARRPPNTCAEGGM